MLLKLSYDEDGLFLNILVEDSLNVTSLKNKLGWNAHD